MSPILFELDEAFSELYIDIAAISYQKNHPVIRVELKGYDNEQLTGNPLISQVVEIPSEDVQTPLANILNIIQSVLPAIVTQRYPFLSVSE